MTTSRDRLIGRDGELATLVGELDAVGAGASRAVALSGEAGIGKTRLLRELGNRAELRGLLVLSGSGSELERDLPFSVFVNALDEYVGSLGRHWFGRLENGVQAELASVFPSLSNLADQSAVAPQHERYRSHRAVRLLLQLLAERRPLALVLDDVHWADPASIELLGALLRRPPAARVLIALAYRSSQLPDRLSGPLERAGRTATLARIDLAPLTQRQTRELLEGVVNDTEARFLFDETGGNPFYLEQLARSSRSALRAAATPAESPADIGVPPAVAASIGEELRQLHPVIRLVLEGAAVAGDPFEPELAAAAADLAEDASMEAIDELLRADLVRATDVPRRFAFRHPLVRRAVYGSSARAWRLGAHERCAAALSSRGTPAVGRAHHVERSARQGDRDAIAVLREAGEAARRLAPESAARWFGAAVRLYPADAPTEDRVELLLARAKALAAAGRFHESHEAVLEAGTLIPAGPGKLFATVATSCASIERLLGRYEDAHGRLVGAVRALPETASVERVELLMELTLNEFYRSRYEAMHDWADLAYRAASEIGDSTLIAAAAVMPAFAQAMTGPTEIARERHAGAAALVDRLSDAELAARPHTAGWLAIAEIYIDLFAEADDHASRALRLTRETGEGDPLHRLYPVLPRVWYVRGKLREAAELLDGAIEAGRLLGSPPALAGNLFNRSVVALAADDLDLALATAEESYELTRGLDAGFVSAWAGARLAHVLYEMGDPDAAAEMLLDRAGGPQLTRIPGSWRSYWLELLTRCWLATGRPTAAEDAAGQAKSTAAAIGLPLATAWADRAAAEIAFSAGNSAAAIARALASAAVADEAGAPIEAALSRILAGRALGQAGEAGRAVVELERAASALDACGASRYRASAEHELGKLGHRPHRRTRRGTAHGYGIALLTGRELEVTRLVVDRRTNVEIAAMLFLSRKTVETHLRNIFNKVGVDSRAGLARVVEQGDRATDRSAGLPGAIG